MALARAEALIGASDALLGSTSEVVAAALATRSAVTEAQLEDAAAGFKRTKHEFIDQRAKVLLAAALTAGDPFAELAGGAREAQDAALAERKAAVRAAKADLEGARADVGRLCEGIAAQHASLHLAKAQLATEVALLRQASAGARGEEGRLGRQASVGPRA